LNQGIIMKINSFLVFLFFITAGQLSYSMEGMHDPLTEAKHLIYRGELQQLEKHIKAYSLNLNYLLYCASEATQNRTAIAQWLIDKGADVNTINDWGYSTLDLAVLNNNLQLAKLLVAKGFNVDNIDISKLTYDLCFTLSSYEEIAEWLLDTVTDINKQNPFSGNTALHNAITQEWGGPSIIILTALLNKNADTTIKNNSGQTALDCAIAQNKQRAIDTLECHNKIKQAIQTKQPTTKLLESAIENHFVPLVKQLLEAGIKPTAAHLQLAKDNFSQEIGRLLVRYLGVTGNQLLLSQSGINNTAHYLPEDITNQIQLNILN
jgi:uncharacterized protein